MFDIKRQPKLYLVDVWYQTSTRTLSGWCLISVINLVATGSRLIFIYSRYVFSLHFRVSRFQKRYTILTLFWLDFVIFACMKIILRQTSTKAVPGWCLISNVNQNCIWLMFDIKCQPELYLVDVWYQSSIGWLLVHDWYSYTLGKGFLCISGYVDSKKRIQFWHFFDWTWYQTSTRTLSGWCLISIVKRQTSTVLRCRFFI